MRTRSIVVGIAFVLAGAGCASSKRGVPVEGPLAKSSAGGLSPVGGAAAAPRVCTHDAKDLAPCAEDCDRAIAFACTVLAARIERGDGVPRNLTRAAALHERGCET